MEVTRAHWKIEDLNERQQELLARAGVSLGGAKSKYHTATKKERRVDGIIFQSKKEKEYYLQLKMLQKAGQIRFFLRQVPFELPGGVRYYLDFLEFWADGRVRFVDVKGYKTAPYKIKKKQVEATYNIQIEEE